MAKPASLTRRRALTWTLASLIHSQALRPASGEPAPPAAPPGTAKKARTPTQSTQAQSRTQDEVAAGVTPKDYNFVPGDVRRYGADPTGDADSTAAIQSAINVGAVNGLEILVAAGTYKLTAGTSITGEFGGGRTALTMASNMHIRGESGATLRMADDQSTVDHPQNVQMFFTNSVLSNLSFTGLTLDMNGDHNRINNRATYFVMAMICVSGTPGGVAAACNDVLVDNCRFINGPGLSCILMAQSNSPRVTLGKRWTVRNCLFHNNGLYIFDHSSIFGWADYVSIEHNTFTHPTMAGDGRANGTGPQVAHEIHGSHHTIVGNTIKNYYQGFWLSTNYSSTSDQILIDGNTIGPIRAIGIDTSRQSAKAQPIRDVVISNNTIEITDDPTKASPKVAISLSPQYAIENVLVQGNHAVKRGTIVGSVFLRCVSSSTPGQRHDAIKVRDNTCESFSVGVQVTTTAANGFGSVEVAGNTFQNLNAAGGLAKAIGVISSGPGVFTNLTVRDNEISGADYGVYISAPAATLNVDGNKYSSIKAANYIEPGRPAISNRQGSQFGAR
jgi:hypothetical protein